MSRHVDHLLAAYIGGQLSAAQTARVVSHLRACQTCRDRLDVYDRLSGDLRLFLGSRPQASRNDINGWWDRIAQARVSRQTPAHVRALAPAFVLIVALGLPLVAGLTGITPRPAQVRDYVEDTTASAPATSYLAVGLAPQPQPADHTSTVIATSAPQDNAVTPAPVPLAPSAQ